VLRDALGGAFITMNLRELGANTAFAWPGAEKLRLAAMDAVIEGLGRDRRSGA
jgi:acetyl-CoA carboxylase carboxyltransferase component